MVAATDLVLVTNSNDPKKVAIDPLQITSENKLGEENVSSTYDNLEVEKSHLQITLLVLVRP